MKFRFFSYFLLITSGISCYVHTLDVPFILDDSGYIGENLDIRDLSPSFSPNPTRHIPIRPLVMWSFALNYHVHGLTVTGYHLVNITLHIVAAIVLFEFLCLIFTKVKSICINFAHLTSLAIALIWLVHPMNTESVTYIYQRCEIMVGLFILLTLYFAVRSFLTCQRRDMFLSIVCACLGANCKAVIVAVPLLVIVFDYLFLLPSFKECLKKRWSLYSGLMLSWLFILFFMFQNYNSLYNTAEPAYSVGEYFRTQLNVVLHYIKLSIIPSGLCFDRGWEVQEISEVLFSGVIIFFLIAITLFGFVKKSKLSFLGITFIMLLAPSSSFLPLKNIYFEHRMYVAIIPIIILFILFLNQLTRLIPRGKIPFTAIIFALASIYSVMCYQRNQLYRDKIDLWSDTLKNNPHHFRAYASLALELGKRGHTQKAIEHYHQCLEIHPNYSAALDNLGSLYERIGDRQGALKYYHKAVSAKPKNAKSRYNLFKTYMKQREFNKAHKHLKIALKLEPNNPTILNKVAWFYATSPDPQIRNGKEALKYAQQLYQLTKNREPDPLNVLAAAYAANGQFDQAVIYIDQAIHVAQKQGQNNLIKMYQLKKNLYLNKTPYTQ